MTFNTDYLVVETKKRITSLFAIITPCLTYHVIDRCGIFKFLYSYEVKLQIKKLDILIATHLKNQIHPFLCSALIMTQLESNQKLIVDFILIRQFFKII